MSEEDIRSFCSDNGVYCTFSDANMIIASYDGDGNKRMSYDEFLSLVLSATSPSLRAICQARESSPYLSRRHFLSSDVEFYLSRVFSKEINYQRSVEEHKRTLNYRYDYSVSGCFNSIDAHAPLGRVDRYEIRSFTQTYHRYLSEDDLDSIIRRADTDEDELLDYAEFADAIKYSGSSLPSAVSSSYTSIKPRASTSYSPLRNSESRFASPPPRRTFSPMRASMRSTYYSPAK